MERPNAYQGQSQFDPHSSNAEQYSGTFSEQKAPVTAYSGAGAFPPANLSKALFETIKEGNLKKIEDFICTFVSNY